MEVLCVIPARSGSQRIKEKNLRKIMGKSLVSLAADIANSSSYVTNTVVSSDDQRMADGHYYIERPMGISGPTADISAATSHALELAEAEFNKRFDYVVTLQPAVPIRNVKYLDALLDAVIRSGANGGITGAEIVPWRWEVNTENMSALNGWYPAPYPRSQSFEGTVFWQEVNSIQIASREAVIAGQRWGTPLMVGVMPSYAVCDIDTEEDFQRASKVLPLLLECLDGDPLKILRVNKINEEK